MDDDRAHLPPGTRFGSYRVESLLGAGAMGAVYLATHVGLGKRVVVKVLHPEHARSANVRARFFREGRAAAAIRHPHVVDVTDVGEHDGVGYLVMEHLDGETLGALVSREGALPAGRAVDLLLPIVAAVDAAHAAGVIHRDLKPENLFVARGATGEPHPKVLDFGISRVVHEAGRRTGTAAVLGTPAYMAPEQIASTRDADARSDQYALGVILYECVTGRAAFRGDNVYAILKRVGDADFARPSLAPVALPPGLEGVILRAMARDPDARFASLREFGRALLPYAGARARGAWGAVFDPGASHAPTVIGFAPQGGEAWPGAPAGDTLADAAQAHDTVPTTRRPARVYALALAAAVAIAVVTSVVLRRPRGPEVVSPRVDARRATPSVAAVAPPTPAPPSAVPPPPARPSAAPPTPASPAADAPRATRVISRGVAASRPTRRRRPPVIRTSPGVEIPVLPP